MEHMVSKIRYMWLTHVNVLLKEPLDSMARFSSGLVWILAWIDVRGALGGQGLGELFG